MKAITNESVFYISIILLIIIVTSVMSWREKNKARNFVLGSRFVLHDLINQAQDLLDKNPFLKGSFFSDLEEIGRRFTNMFYDINENSFDVCWSTKQKEVMNFEHLIITKTSEIKENIQIELDAIIHVPILLQLLPPILSEVRKKISDKKLSEGAKTHLDHAHGWFGEACAVMRQNQDHALAWGMLKNANEQLDIADSFELS